MRLLGNSLVLILTPTVFGASIGAQGYITTISGGTDDFYKLIDVATASDAITRNATIGAVTGGRYAIATHNLRAKIGDIGYGTSGSSSCPVDGCGVERGDGSMFVITMDGLSFSAPSGILRLEVLLEGEYGLNALSPSDHINTGLVLGRSNVENFMGASLHLDPNTETSEILYQSPGSTMTAVLGFDPVTNLRTYRLSGTVDLPFTNGTFALGTQFYSDFACTGNTASDCSFVNDFYNTARVGGALILDSNGDVIPGATMWSESTFDYTAPLDAVDGEVPEASTCLLVAAGLGLFRVCRRKSAS
jgi:hypothetical protein